MDIEFWECKADLAILVLEGHRLPTGFEGDVCGFGGETNGDLEGTDGGD